MTRLIGAGRFVSRPWSVTPPAQASVAALNRRAEDEQGRRDDVCEFGEDVGVRERGGPDRLDPGATPNPLLGREKREVDTPDQPEGRCPEFARCVTGRQDPCGPDRGRRRSWSRIGRLRRGTTWNAAPATRTSTGPGSGSCWPRRFRPLWASTPTRRKSATSHTGASILPRKLYNFAESTVHLRRRPFSRGILTSFPR